MRKCASMSILIFVLFVGVCLSITAHAQEAEIPEVEWSIYAGGTRTDFGDKLLIDAENNLYLFGHTRSLDLEGRSNQISNAPFPDGYISKISADQREIIWAMYFGGDRISPQSYGFGTSFTSAVYCPEEGVIYAVGVTGAENLPAKLNERVGGRSEGFVSKITTDGEVLWSTYIGGEGRDNLIDIVILRNGNILVGGTTQSNDLSGKVNERTCHEELFLSELTSNGELIWSRYMGVYTIRPQVRIVNNNVDDDVYVAVTLTSAKDADELFDLPMDDYEDTYVARISPMGEMRWLSKIGHRGNDRAHDIALDSQMNIFVVGITTGIRDIDGQFPERDKHPAALNSRYSSSDAFVAKLNPDGEVLWSRYIGGRTGHTLEASIAIDTLDNIFIIGNTTATDLTGKLNERSEGHNIRDAFIANLSADGKHHWSYYCFNLGNLSTHRVPIAILKDDRTLYMAGSTISRNLPNRINEYHEPEGEVEHLPFDIFVAEIRLPLDAEAEVEVNGINDGEGAE